MGIHFLRDETGSGTASWSRSRGESGRLFAPLPVVPNAVRDPPSASASDAASSSPACVSLAGLRSSWLCQFSSADSRLVGAAVDEWPRSCLQLDTRGVELARRDREEDQILGIEPVRSFALLQIPIESALDAGEPHPILPKHFVLFGRYQHPRLVGEDMPFLVRAPRAVSHNTYVRLLFAFNVAQFRARRQEKKSQEIIYVMACASGTSSVLLPHGMQCFSCLMAGRPAPI